MDRAYLHACLTQPSPLHVPGALETDNFSWCFLMSRNNFFSVHNTKCLLSKYLELHENPTHMQHQHELSISQKQSGFIFFFSGKKETCYRNWAQMPPRSAITYSPFTLTQWFALTLSMLFFSNFQNCWVTEKSIKLATKLQMSYVSTSHKIIFWSFINLFPISKLIFIIISCFCSLTVLQPSRKVNLT